MPTTCSKTGRCADSRCVVGSQGVSLRGSVRLEAAGERRPLRGLPPVGAASHASGGPRVFGPCGREPLLVAQLHCSSNHPSSTAPRARSSCRAVKYSRPTSPHMWAPFGTGPAPAGRHPLRAAVRHRRGRRELLLGTAPRSVPAGSRRLARAARVLRCRQRAGLSAAVAGQLTQIWRTRLRPRPTGEGSALSATRPPVRYAADRSRGAA